MTRTRLILLAILGLMIGLGYLGYRNVSLMHEHKKAAKGRLQASKALQAQENARRSALPGDAILQNYGSPSTRPKDDLEALAHGFSNLRLLVKGDSPFHMGANEEFAAALKGKNRSQQRFVSDGNRVFNAHGQLIDRWDTPLYFHAVSQDRVDIRSAGPDRQMWTDDDLHRRYDGTFLQGDALNPASLFEVEPPQGPPKK